MNGDGTTNAVANPAGLDSGGTRRIAALMGVVAVSLAVASILHLTGHVDGRSAPFDADHAGIAEAVIGVVVAAAALTMWRDGRRARVIGLGATGFAIVGFLIGLTITSTGGHLPDIAYHLIVLPVLIGSFVVLLRRTRH
jgi:peptidoglycan/LPS O-acetylase OafA/YrhL